ncbi:PepSY domain-containing protein [Streptomyces acidiscabies]|uniref:PepSY domain-containing protein n=1 Tax=Streptomyces acidiscabies TaxID=42234 RepID=UPI00096791E8|nr:PepSY domain-containing protein [Streptomyces acidiscabies]GAV40784.1 peptidase propeptide and YPEB domain protein [Streptomyces acidiscabies]
MKRSITITAVAVSAALAGGTALALTNGEGRGGESREGVEQVRVAVQADDADRAGQSTVTTSGLTVAQAIDAALKSRPGTVLSADLDTDDADRGWEVEILASDTKTYEVRVDPATGKVLAAQVDRDTDADDRRVPEGLTARQATEAAAPKGTVVSVDSDNNHGGVWEVETRDAQGKERDWNVNAKNGTVTADRED